MFLLIFVIVLFVIVYFSIGAYAASQATQVGDHPIYHDTPATFGLDYEEVRFKARGDGIQIAAWYIPHESTKQAVIIVHGHNASKQWAASGKLPKLGVSLNRAGFAVLMIDLRGHGDSQGKRASMGVHERWDVLGALDWLKEEGFDPSNIGLIGISMGGSAVLGAALEEPVTGPLVIESTVADVKPIIETKWSEKSGLPNFFLPGAFLMHRLMYGFDISRVRPVEDLENMAWRPVLLIHCKGDKAIPIWHAEMLKKAAPYAETWFVNGSEHAEIYRDYPGKYEEKLIAFFKQYLR